MDIVCQAKSGMGKTAVFVLATLQQLEPVDGQVGNELQLNCIHPEMGLCMGTVTVREWKD